MVPPRPLFPERGKSTSTERRVEPRQRFRSPEILDARYEVILLGARALLCFVARPIESKVETTLTGTTF
jgi:hypothetical protein